MAGRCAWHRRVALVFLLAVAWTLPAHAWRLESLQIQNGGTVELFEWTWPPPEILVCQAANTWTMPGEMQLAACGQLAAATESINRNRTTVSFEYFAHLESPGPHHPATYLICRAWPHSGYRVVREPGDKESTDLIWNLHNAYASTMTLSCFYGGIEYTCRESWDWGHDRRAGVSVMRSRNGANVLLYWDSTDLMTTGTIAMADSTIGTVMDGDVITLAYGASTLFDCCDPGEYFETQITGSLAVRDIAMVTKLTVLDGNLICDIPTPSNLVWERTLNPDCTITDKRVSLADYPIVTQTNSWLNLEAVVQTCSDRTDPLKVDCRVEWNPGGSGMIGVVPQAGSTEQMSIVNLVIPTPPTVGQYEIRFKFTMTDPQTGDRTEEILDRLVYVIWAKPPVPFGGVGDRCAGTEGLPKIVYERSCLWAQQAGTAQEVIQKLRRGIYESGEWIYAPGPNGHRCSMSETIALWEGRGSCRNGTCGTFSVMLQFLCNVHGITEVGQYVKQFPMPDAPELSGRTLLVTTPKACIDPRFTGNVRDFNSVTGEHRYAFTGHQFLWSALPGMPVFQDPTFDAEYATAFEWMWFAVDPMRKCPECSPRWCSIERESIGAYCVKEVEAYEADYGVWGAYEYSAGPLVPESLPASAPDGGRRRLILDAAFTGEVVFAPVDDATDGVYEMLVADLGLEVRSAGTYVVEGSLWRDSTLITSRMGTGGAPGSRAVWSGEPGVVRLQICFSGEDIFRSGLDGPYTLALSLRSGSAAGEELTCLSPAYPHTAFGEDPAAIGGIADRAIDTNGDGSLEELVAQVDVQARIGGRYQTVAALLADSVTVASASADSILDAGAHVLEPKFPGRSVRAAGLNGPYRILVSLYGPDGSIVSSEETTTAYQAADFAEAEVHLDGDHESTGLDLNGDGSYETLRFLVDLEVRQPGDYHLSARLRDCAKAQGDASLITMAGADVALAQGLNTVALDFSGVAIAEHHADGPYILDAFEVRDAGYNLLSAEHPAYPSAPYSWWVFSPPGACCSVDGSCTVALQVHCPGQWTVAESCAPSPCVRPSFLRGDVNASGTLSVADPIANLTYQFAGGAAPPCLAAADDDGSGEVNIADAIYSLVYQFGDGPAPVAPFPTCGSDPSPGLPGCQVGAPCGLAGAPKRRAPAPSPGSGKVRMGAAYGASGDTLTVPIRLETSAAILGFEFTVSFDPLRLEFVALERDADLDFFSARSETGRLRVGGVVDLQMRTPLLPGQHDIGWLRFVVRSGGGGAEIRLSEAQFVATDLTTILAGEEGVVIDNPGTTGAAAQGGARVPRLSFANPYRLGDAIALAAAPGQEAIVSLYNVHGRQVRDLLSGRVTAEQQLLRWDGRTDAGQEAGTGIYYLRVVVGSTRITQKLLFLR